jgi:hypothetical protein
MKIRTKRPYHKKHFQNLPLDVQKRIYDLISRGKSLYQIIKLESVSISSLHLLFNEIQKPVSRGKIGYRNEAYHTEEYLINGYIAPTYDELSESEKVIYNMKKI